MNNLFVVLTLIFMGCSTQFDIGKTEQEVHSWSSYHWDSNSLSITVENKMKGSGWKPFFDESIRVWDTLGTPLTLTATDSNGMVSTDARRSQQWLGLATVYLNADGHITAGKVTMNPIMLTDPRYTPTAVQHVFCQELGHVLGLGHIVADTCMDDCSWASTSEVWLSCLNDPASVGPNGHDAEQLNLIYNHDDVLPDIPDAGSSDGCGKSKRPGCRQGGWVEIHSFPTFEHIE